MIKDEARASHSICDMFPKYRYGGSLPALLWSFKDFLKGKGRVAATGQGRGRGRIVLSFLDSAGPAASIIHSMARARAKGKTEPVDAPRGGAEQGMANELVEFGDDLDLYVEG